MADAPPPYSQVDENEKSRIGFVDPGVTKASAPSAPSVYVETVHYQQQTTSSGGSVPYPTHQQSMAHSMSAGSVTAATFPAYQQQQQQMPQFEKAVSGAQYQYPPYVQQPHPQYPYPPGHFSAPTGYPPQQPQIQYVMAAPQLAPAAPAQPNVIVVNTTNQQQQTTAVPAQTRTVYIQQKRGVNHLLHFIITLFFAPWLFVWILLCLCDDS